MNPFAATHMRVASMQSCTALAVLFVIGLTARGYHQRYWLVCATLVCHMEVRSH